jgi:hypothetical protein
MFADRKPLPGFDRLTHSLPDEPAQSLRETFAAVKPQLSDREMIVAIAESQPSFIPNRDAGYQWALVVPLLISQRPVGMMVFGSKESTGYSEDQVVVAGRIGE